MRGTKLLTITSVLYIIYALVSFVTVFMGRTNETLNLLSARTEFESVAIAVEGIILLVTGGAALIYRKNPAKVNFIMFCAWASLIISYLVFFLSYGESWGIVLYDLLVVITTIIYFISARRNRNEVGEK